MEEAVQEEIEEIEKFSQIGYISGDFSFAGHSYGLRTLTSAEDIAAAAAIQEFRETLKEPEAWCAAQVALALTYVDDDDDFCPQVGPNLQVFAKARFNWLTSHFHWVIIEEMFNDYASLLRKQLEKVRQVQDLSPGSLPISWPSADSFKTPGTSNDEISLETPSTTA